MKTLDRWINENNVDKLTPKKNYSKGWWDYIEFIRMISAKFNVEAYVVNTYEIGTPPPEEKLILPIIFIEINEIKFYLKEDFSYSGFYDAWLVSVDFGDNLSSFNFKNYINNIDIETIDYKKGFVESSLLSFVDNNIMFENYKKGKLKFTGTVESEFDLYILLKLCVFEREILVK
jgi:hypothetical protein